VQLLIDNPNTEPMRVRGIDFKLRLADEGIVDGQASGDLLVEALDQQTLELEVGSDIVSSLSRLLAFVEGPDNTLTYEIYGIVTVDRRLRQLQFSSRGQVPLVTPAAR
jgi:LEA14-like dessication related protein